MSFEILIPIRNPTDVFRQTAKSLAAQTDKNFTVLISDNFSTSGQEHLNDALAVLKEAGISARRIQPPTELGRVQHWNWVHYLSEADWLKPLFAGDWLEPEYVAVARDLASRESRCAYIFSNFQYHRGDEVISSDAKWGKDRYFTPEEMQDVVLRYGMQFGPPSVAAYRREAFLGAGGYDAALPICADSLLFCKLAARHGCWGVSRMLAHFFVHAARFTHKLPGKEKELRRESLSYIAGLGLTGWQEKWRFPAVGYFRLLGREFWYWVKAR